VLGLICFVQHKLTVRFPIIGVPVLCQQRTLKVRRVVLQWAVLHDVLGGSKSEGVSCERHVCCSVPVCTFVRMSSVVGSPTYYAFVERAGQTLPLPYMTRVLLQTPRVPLP
jgi:hypothetical protein